jgi:predicted metal-dependent hydrolase
MVERKVIEPSNRAQLALPDGRALDFEIRVSPKARSLRVRVSVRDGLVVTAPSGLERGRVLQLVKGKAQWIADRLTQFDAVRHLVIKSSPVRPQAFDLPAIAESWRVEYRATRTRTVGARSDQPGRIIVLGAIDDVERCQAALRRWLARRAKQVLSPWLDSLSKTTGLHYSDATVKTQRTRWGSCSAEGRISLNCKLLFLPRDSVRYVLTHELCHTRELNHTVQFWALLRFHEPSAEVLHAGMRDAWRQVPAWAARVPLGEKSF